MSWDDLPSSYPAGTLLVSTIWLAISFPILGKFSTIISSSIFSWSFFLYSSSGTCMMQKFGHLTLSQRFLRLSSFLLFFFFPFSYLLHFHYSIFHLTYPIFCSVILLLVPSRLLLISVIALFIIDRLFFIYSRSLLNISCIFSILVSSLFICNSILFSRFWIIFTIIILNSFSGRPPISSSFVWFAGHLSCSFTS